MKRLLPNVELSLRERAEQALGDHIPPPSRSVAWRELQVYQVELEMQNEELRRMQNTLEASRDLYLDLYERAPVGYLSLTDSGVVQAVNLRAEQLLRVPRQQLLGRRFDRWVQPDDREGWRGLFVRACRDTAAQEADLRLLRGDGEPLPAHLDCVRQSDGPRLVRLTVTDLSARRKAEETLTLAANVFTHAHEGIMITNASGDIVDVNDAFQTITGYSRAEVLGRNPRLLASGLTTRGVYGGLWRALTEEGFWKGELWNRRRSGEIFVAGQTITAIRDPHGRVQHYVALFTDVTELREHQNRLETIAHYDALTQLPNRVLLGERMQQAFARARHSKRMLAVAYLDLDGFKDVNDTHGHATGDRVLTAVAQRMKHTLREGCTLSRLGGDEFVILITELEQSHDTAPMLDRLLGAASKPVRVDGLQLSLTASMGVTFYPQGQDVSADQLLRQADQAMYQAKVGGKNRYCFFDPEQELGLRVYNARVERILLALHRHEFVLYYQPKVNMRSGEILGVEALIRWQHPEEGLVQPESFLPIIENSQLSQMVGEWVIGRALRQAQTWAACGFCLPISVNVGGWQLQQPDFVARLRRQLEACPGLPRGMLMIEILETSALKDMDRVSETICACKELGVGFALDDFGTGYSSLTYLKRLPVCQLKIDQTFVQGLLEDNDDLSILLAITSLAKAFKREVIAEGVDTVGHGVRLLELGCELAQGFCIAKPMPAAAVPEWAMNWRPSLRWQQVVPLSAPSQAAF
ncbi:GGDEF and EAL domain-containing protein [Pseudomonas sp. RIT-PI-S]|uniref:putative bifunctional diguanylate cyclase/phosphodiesterase n=1 Tax=Pseudomonas sp. RIT-PI-S TaxID=3035295 RepID=UPI0021DB2F88|nr:GGDEF and EAL domain-containing protein [Pseudomonas sp. RIT-PI-S]